MHLSSWLDRTVELPLDEELFLRELNKNVPLPEKRKTLILYLIRQALIKEDKRMTVKITGFADEIAPELTAQIAGLKGLGMSYVEMRGVDGENLIYHTDEKVEQIKKTLDDNGIRLSALGSPLGKILIADDFTPHFEEFKRAVEISHKMECPTIRMFSFYLPQESDPAAYEGEVFDRIGKFVDYASANDTLLLHENEKDIYGAMAPECKKLMDTFYGDAF